MLGLLGDDHFKAIGFVGDQRPLKIYDIAQIMGYGDEEEWLKSDVWLSMILMMNNKNYYKYLNYFFFMYFVYQNSKAKIL